MRCRFRLWLPAARGRLDAGQAGLVAAAVAIDIVLATALLAISLRVGWRCTRTFWIVFGTFTVAVWARQLFVAQAAIALVFVQAGDLLYCGLLATVLAVYVLTAASARESFVCPLRAAATTGGLTSWAIALALAGRVGIAGYAVSLPAIPDPVIERVLHPPAPGPYLALQNPFERPGSEVVIESLGANPDRVVAIVAAAEVHRTEAQARRLLAALPAVVQRSPDSVQADGLAEELRAAGATARALDSAERFADLVRRDADTPLGKLSRLADPLFVTTGRDRLAQLRTVLQRSPESVDRRMAHDASLAYYTLEGRALYQINCRPCHGTKADGGGPLAAGLAIAPANFRAAGRLDSLSPGEVLWRIEEGAAGLPPESAPWASAMPAWKHDFDRETAWKIVLGLYDTAGVAPRAEPGDRHADHPAIVTEQFRDLPLPEHNWIDWPIESRPAASQTQDARFIEPGRYLYVAYCAACHGIAGDGEGPAAHTLWPRPRDFTTTTIEGGAAQPKFKFRSTRTGWLPTDDDLYRTISRGLVGTAMEGWADVLSATERWQLVAYLKTLSPAWTDPSVDNPANPDRIKDEIEFRGMSPLLDFTAKQPPRITAELLRLGEETFKLAQCWQCHGVGARGDGPGFGSHYDVWGYRTWPQNLANAFNFKAGHSIRDIFRTFTTGIDGSVMPSYLGSLVNAEGVLAGLDRTAPASRQEQSRREAHELLGQEADAVLRALDGNDAALRDRAAARLRDAGNAADEFRRWALAAFVARMVRVPDRTRRVVQAAIVGRDPLPADPIDPRWERIAGIDVPLTGQLLTAPRWQNPSVNQVRIKLARNQEAVAIWLQWDDRLANVRPRDTPVREPDDDGGLLGKTYAYPSLPRRGPVVFALGDQIELQWPASRSGPAELPHFLRGDANRPVILWRWQAEREPLDRLVREMAVPGTAGETKTHRDEWVTRGGTGAAGPSAVVEAVAAGTQAEPTPQPHARLQSRARWSDGSWTLVLTRSLAGPGAGEIDLRDTVSTGSRRPTLVPLAVHVWDGSAGETGLRMSLSSWFYAAFQAPCAVPAIATGIAGGLLSFLLAVLVALRLRRRSG